MLSGARAARPQWVLHHQLQNTIRGTQPVTRRYATATSRSSRLPGILISSAIGFTLGVGYYYVTDTRASIHRWLAVPLIRTIWPDAEDAHEAGTHGLRSLWRFGLHPRERGGVDTAGDLQIDVFGYTLDNPLGTSAGLDKHADIPTQILALGPAIIEVGGVTPHPQKGNEKPRVFRVPSQQGMINRYGLNSEGADFVAARLRQRVREFAYEKGFGIDEEAERLVLDGGAGVPPGSLAVGKLMAVQVAKQETTPDGDIEAIERDYVYGTTALARYADIIVVNVSCPNAPGYRELQQAVPLTKILTAVVGAAKSTDRKTKPAVMVKVSPDEDTEEQVTSICAAVWASGVDGVIVGNTTKRRQLSALEGTQLSRTEAAVMLEQGGYSGPQLFEQTLSLVGKYRRILDQGARFQEAQTSPKGNTASRIEASVEQDARSLKSPAADSSGQPLIRLPERHSSATKDAAGSGDAPALSASHHLEQASPAESTAEPAQKVIFCTGGITNGKQALEVLNAGSSVAQVYTGSMHLSNLCILLTRFSHGLRWCRNIYSYEEGNASGD